MVLTQLLVNYYCWFEVINQTWKTTYSKVLHLHVHVHVCTVLQMDTAKTVFPLLSFKKMLSAVGIEITLSHSNNTSVTAIVVV